MIAIQEELLGGRKKPNVKEFDIKQRSPAFSKILFWRSTNTDLMVERGGEKKKIARICNATPCHHSIPPTSHEREREIHTRNQQWHQPANEKGVALHVSMKSLHAHPGPPSLHNIMTVSVQSAASKTRLFLLPSSSCASPCTPPPFPLPGNLHTRNPAHTRSVGPSANERNSSPGDEKKETEQERRRPRSGDTVPITEERDGSCDIGATSQRIT